MGISIVEARPDHAPFIAWVVLEKRSPDFERVWGCPGMRALTRRL